MKYKKMLSLFLAFVLCIMPINSFAAGTPPKDGAYGQGTRTDPVRYLDFHSYLEITNDIAAPTARNIVPGTEVKRLLWWDDY